MKWQVIWIGLVSSLKNKEGSGGLRQEGKAKPKAGPKNNVKMLLCRIGIRKGAGKEKTKALKK